MTYNEIINIAKRLDEETKKRIDQEVEERLEILKLGDLDEEQMDKMEECLYMSLVIQEYLDGEYELIDEERAFLLAEMEELYGEYNDLLLKAKLEEKVSKKKRLALELMRIREKLFNYKDQMKDVKKNMKANRDNKKQLEDLSSQKKMKEVAKENKKSKWGLDGDAKIENQNKKGNGDGTINTREAAEYLKRDSVAMEQLASEVAERLNSPTLSLEAEKNKSLQELQERLQEVATAIPGVSIPNPSSVNGLQIYQSTFQELVSSNGDNEFNPEQFDAEYNKAKNKENSSR